MSRSEIIVWLRRYVSAGIALVLCLVLTYQTVSRQPLPLSAAESVDGADTPQPAGRVIVLDAGHGGEDCGAVGVNGVYEKDINMSITSYLAAYLRVSGCRVIQTRTDDRLLYDPATVVKGHKKADDLANRRAVAEAQENAILVSIHMNSYPGESSSGLQVWYSAADARSRTLAEGIQAQTVAKLQADNHRKVMASNGNMFLLDRVSCPAVLVECGFLTNRAECEKLSTDAYQKELSFVLFCAMMEYINSTV